MAEIQYASATQTTQQTQTSATYGDVSGVSIAADTFAAGTRVLVLCTAMLSSGTGSTFRWARVVHGSTAFAESECIDHKSGADHYVPYQFFTVWTVVAGEALKLQFASNGSATAKIDQCFLFAMNLDDDLVENTDWFFNERSTNDALTSTTVVDGAYVSFTPEETDHDYLVLCYAQHDPADTSTQMISALYRNGVVSGSIRHEGFNASQQFCALQSNVYTEGTSLVTFTEGSSASAAAAHNRLHSSIFVLDLTKFRSWASAHASGDVALGTTSFGTQLQTVNITPAVAGPCLVGATFGYDNNATANVASFRVQVDGSDALSGMTTDAYIITTKDNTDERPVASASMQTLTAAAHTIDLDASVNGTTSTPTAQYRSLWVFSMELADGSDPDPGGGEVNTERPTPKLEMCFSGNLFPKLEASGCNAAWPLADTYPTEVIDLIGGFDGSAPTTVVLGAHGMIPEYGCAMEFDGSTSTFSIADNASLRPIGPFAIGALILLGDTAPANETIFRKENGGTGGRIVLGLKATGPKLFVGANIAGTYRETEYTIADPAAWASTPRMVFGIYDGSALKLVELSTVDGTLTTLATNAYSGVVATGTNTAIYVGSNSGSSEFFNGRLQWLCFWVDDSPTTDELEDFAESLYWTEVTDWMRDTGIEVTWGLGSGSPTARVAVTGSLQFDLNNDISNSGQLLGYYSPNHANKRGGFDYSIPVRFSVTDPASPDAPYYKFVGKLVDITPEGGEYLSRVTHCRAVDYMDELARMAQPSIPIITNDDSIEIQAKLVNYVTNKPHAMTPISGGVETFVYGIDVAQDELSAVLQELKRVVDSEPGFLYLRGGQSGAGILTCENRQVRQLKTVDWTFDNDMVGLEVTRTRNEIINRVRATSYPRTVDSAATTELFRLNTVVPIPAGERISFRAPYTASSGAGTRIGGKDVVTPVITTDYTANSAADGSGSNLTATMVVEFTGGANSAEVAITNNDVVTAYITLFKIRGKGVYTYNAVTIEAVVEESRRKHGDNVLSLDMPYQHDPSAAKTAGEYVLNIWQNEATLARRMTIMPPDDDTDLKTTACAIDVGDMVRVTETVTGLSGHEYFVNHVSMKVWNADWMEVEVQLQPGDNTTGWLLGVVGRGELGVATYLGF
jgi:hypothetical protein